MKLNKLFFITFFAVYVFFAVFSTMYSRVRYGSDCTLSFIVTDKLIIGLTEDWILKLIVSVLFAFTNSNLLSRKAT
ncbi:hypothetical protein [Clostridium magnum]|uniref:Uncharacterized protein n=1 Tax=Clostridium magnum DSM 2767 TaxID=1121326 RepID=A0A162RUZ0_9CLOT|nr:hypothetical protein [Clostridium magnum]KZL90411.1 hypothetical protein CLMAG_41820 [Clostridium magnum DSM 2767]SHH84480.1 hypothetical protein SAMN02745944_01559 [Clostridium magnum DSM 2767]